MRERAASCHSNMLWVGGPSFKWECGSVAEVSAGGVVAQLGNLTVRMNFHGNCFGHEARNSLVSGGILMAVQCDQ